MKPVTRGAEGDFDGTFVERLESQSWALYSVGMVMIVLRM